MGRRVCTDFYSCLIRVVCLLIGQIKADSRADNVCERSVDEWNDENLTEGIFFLNDLINEE